MRVLILAYDYYPLPSIAAQRPYCWKKYLPTFGARVTVITRQWPASIQSGSDYVKPIGNKHVVRETDQQGNTLLAVPYTPAANDRLLLKYGLQRAVYLRKALSFLNSILPFFALRFDNRAAIYRAAKAYLEQEGADVIIATGEPLILFRYASLLSRQFNIPWVADYRDAFTSAQGNNQRHGLASILNSFHRYFEKRYLRTVRFITTAAPSYARLIASYAGRKKIHVIYNGYDLPAQLPSTATARDKFRIAYGGILYPHQRLDMFFEGLQLFLEQQGHPADVEIVFYGLQPQADMVDYVRKTAGKMQSLVTFTPRYSYQDVLEQFRASNVLLLLSAKDAEWLNAKVFDYMAVGRPVLLVENDRGVLEQLVKSTQIGYAASTAHEVAVYLAERYNQFRQGLPDNVQGRNTEVYTRKHQAGELLRVLKEELKQD